MATYQLNLKQSRKAVRFAGSSAAAKWDGKEGLKIIIPPIPELNADELQVEIWDLFENEQLGFITMPQAFSL